jgi:hypothetical protein
MRGVGLIAMNAVILTDLPQLPGEPEILLARQWVIRQMKAFRAPIVTAHGGHGKIPGIEACFGAQLHGLFFADEIGSGFNFS